MTGSPHQGAQVKVGHFQRFSHDKVLIQKRGNAALKVLSGSANFSVRGLYVQSNNAFTFDDQATRPCTNRPSSNPGTTRPGSPPASSPRAGTTAEDTTACPATRSASALTIALQCHSTGSPCRNQRHELRPVRDHGDRRRAPGRLSTPSGPCRHGPSSMRSARRNDSTAPSKSQKSGDPADTTFIPFSFFLTRSRRRSEPNGAAARARSSTTSSSSPTSMATARSCSPAHPTSRPAAKSKTATTSCASPTAASPPIRDRGDPARGPLPLPGRHAEGHRRPAAPAPAPQR